MTDYILYQTVLDADGEEVEAHRWTCEGLRDAITDLHHTRTAHCDGIDYKLAHYQPWNATLLLTVQNGVEFRTGCNVERVLAIIGISRGSARRLSRLLGCEWCA